MLIFPRINKHTGKIIDVAKCIVAHPTKMLGGPPINAAVSPYGLVAVVVVVAAREGPTAGAAAIHV